MASGQASNRELKVLAKNLLHVPFWSQTALKEKALHQSHKVNSEHGSKQMFARALTV